MDDKLSRLTAIGFTLAGAWKSSDGGISCDLNQFARVRNSLYAFTVDGCLMNVGKTIQPLRDRMGGYRNPAPSQATNIKNNRYIRECLAAGKCVDVYVLPDNGLWQFGGFHLNLAAGLEDSVVRDLDPPWNGGQKESPNQVLQPAAAASFTSEDSSLTVRGPGKCA